MEIESRRLLLNTVFGKTSVLASWLVSCAENLTTNAALFSPSRVKRMTRRAALVHRARKEMRDRIAARENSYRDDHVQECPLQIL